MGKMKENELENDLIIHQKRKRIGIILTKLSVFFMPYIVFLLVISLHSKRLISNGFQLGLKIFTGINIILFIIGIILLVKNYKVRNNKLGNLFLKSVYYIVVGVSSLCVLFFLYLLYEPSSEFKKMIIEREMKENKNFYYCKWLYTDKEIDNFIDHDDIEDEKETSFMSEPEMQNAAIDISTDNFEMPSN